ncbi:MAG: hydroxymethylbilane synthase [Acidimicrobiia bacterium]|nr:hydroxymethylbilane synthase [Acidimicrobiia bacterium]
MTAPIRIATRGSALARWQSERVMGRLGVPADLVIVTTRGDQDRTTAIHALGGTGVFVKEVQDAVLRGDADIAVHSAKDLPATTEPGLALAAVPERADVRDALIGARLADIPTGGTVGTGSVRRRSQLAAIRPDLQFAELRGNVPTRVERAGEFDAIVLAVAALERLELADHIAERLDLVTMLPMVGQGALAVECRADDVPTIDALGAIDDVDAHQTVRAERAFLRALGGGCSMPCAAYATTDQESGMTIDALLASLDGSTVLRAQATGTDAESVGEAVAHTILDDLGGRALLDTGVSS